MIIRKKSLETEPVNQNLCTFFHQNRREQKRENDNESAKCIRFQ